MIRGSARWLVLGALLGACTPPEGDTGDPDTREFAYRGTWDGADFQRATLSIASRPDGGQTVTGTSVLDYAAVLAIRLVVSETVEIGPDGRVETWVQDQRNLLGTSELSYHFEVDADAGTALQGLADHGASFGWSDDAPVLTYAWPSDGFFQVAHPTPVAGYVTGQARATGADLRVVLPWYGVSESWSAADDPLAECFHWFGDRWCLDDQGVPTSFVAASYGLPVGRLEPGETVDVDAVSVPAPSVEVAAPDCAVPPPGPRHVAYRVGSADGTVIAGRLLLPVGDGPFPAVTTNAGTGGLDRSGVIPPSRQWDCLAHDLLAAGIAVASYDDRGHGESDGAYGHSFHGRTDDVVAVAEWVAARPEVSSLFLLGHSEGAAHVTAAGAFLDVDGLVLVAGLSGTGAQGWLDQARVYLEGLGFPEAQVTALVDGRESLIDRISSGTYGEDSLAGLPVDGFWAPFLAYDGTALALSTEAPVLVVQGGADWQVPAHHGTALHTALQAAGRDVTLASFPDLGHLMQPAIGPAPCGLEYHLPWSWDAEVTEGIGEWIAARSP